MAKAKARKSEKKQAPVTASGLRDQIEAQLRNLEETASTHYTSIRGASAQALKSVESVEKAVAQGLASKDVRERMKAVRKEIRKHQKASRKELSSLGKATERELSAFGAALKKIAGALTTASPEKSKKRVVKAAVKQTAARKTKAPAAKNAGTKKTPAKKVVVIKRAAAAAPLPTTPAKMPSVTPPAAPATPPQGEFELTPSSNARMAGARRPAPCNANTTRPWQVQFDIGLRGNSYHSFC